MELQKQNMALAVKSFDHNVQLMEEKTDKAMTALSGIKTVNSDEEDEIASHLLGRVRPTFEAVQKMRKEITDPMDSIKSQLMEFEKKISTAKGSGSEYARVKQLRDAYANKKAAEAREEQNRIQRQKDIKIEEANIKSQLVKSIELGVFDLIKEGEVGLTKFVAGMTLENFDEQLGKLNYKPKLKPDAYSKLMQVTYNKELISVDAYNAILKGLGENFQYDNVNAAYSEQAILVLERFKNEVIPLRKVELKERAKSSEVEQKIKAEQDQKDLDAKLEEVEQSYESEKKDVAEKADDAAAEVMIDAEFEAQVSTQTIEEQKGIRKNIVYSINEDIINKPAAVIDVLIKVMTNVMVDAKFKGVIKRDNQKFPILGSDGKIQFVDGVAFWLKELSKLKIDINIDNLNKTEEVSTIVKS